jgi:PIN domain nuclease of toxin-antitoxin system
VRLLLDTHILLWWLEDSPLLSRKAHELIADAENTIFISAITTWEIWLKHSLGKLALPDDFQEQLKQEEFESLPLFEADTKGVAELAWHHRDPFDRMLIAHARSSRLTLLSADTIMAAYGANVLLA